MPLSSYVADSIFPRRALAYLITGVVIGLPFLGVVWLIGHLVILSDNVWILVALFLVTAGVTWPVFNLTLRAIDRAWYAGRYRYFQSLGEFINQTQSISDPRHVDRKVAELICGALDCSCVYLLIPDIGGAEFSVSVCYPDAPCHDIRLKSGGALVGWLEDHRKTLTIAEAFGLPGFGTEETGELAELKRAGVELISPIALRGGRLAALLLVGPGSKGRYHEDDRKALLVMSGHLAVTLENTRLYRESQAIRQNLENWLDGIGDAVIIARNDMTVSFMNRSARAAFGDQVGESCYRVLGREETCDFCPMPGVNSQSVLPLRIAEINNRFYEIAAAPLLETGGRYSLIKVLRDVTDRQTAAWELQQSEQRFRTLAELLPNMIFVLKNGELKYGNQKFFNMTSHLRLFGDGEADDVIMLFRPECRPLVAQDLARRLAGEPVAPRECCIQAAGGIEIPVILALEAFEDEGQVTVVGVVTDITPQKNAEEERRKLEAQMAMATHLASIGDMASGIAHEINNPLTGVIGFSQLLAQREDLPESIREDADIIDRGAQRVAGIVRRLMTFASPREPVQEKVDINTLLEETLELMEPDMEHLGIAVSACFQPDMPCAITDGSQIQQVFLNILNNAMAELKDTDSPRQVRVETARHGDMITVSFADTGRGIPPEHLPRVFDPFFTTREVGQGTGLGLSVCHGIVTRNRGRITADNREGGGAVFTVELPVAADA